MLPPLARHPLTKALPSLLIAAALSLLLALPASAAFSPQQVLRAAHDQLAAAVLASDRGNVVAGWLEPDMSLDLRISHDGGRTFGRRVAMGYALSASLALCDGMIVVERWDGTAIKLDLRSLDGHLATTRTLATGPRFTFEAGVACVGTRRAIVEWSVWHNAAWHLRTALVPLFEPLPSVVYDLGTVPRYEAFPVAATDRSAWIAWEHGDNLRVRRFDVADDDQATVTAHRGHVVAVVPGGMSSPRMAAIDDRVYLAYGAEGATVMRYSVDAGDSFGDPEVMFDPAGGPPSGPADLHVTGQEVLVGVHQGEWGDVGSNWGMLSIDGGAHWTTGSRTTGGYQVDCLVHHNGITRVAEVWDDRTLDIPHHHVRFHVGSI